MKNKIVVFSFCMTLQIVGVLVIVTALLFPRMASVALETAIIVLLVSGACAMVSLLPWLRIERANGERHG